MLFKPQDCIFLIGHRGSGKTSLLGILRNLLADDWKLIDLDTAITQRYGNISTIFQSHGENFFRSIEKQTLQHILSTRNQKIIVALGAGFELSQFEFPKSSIFLWIRRATDLCERFYPDRPMIHGFQERLHQREELYHTFATVHIHLPEGIFLKSTQLALWKRAFSGHLPGAIVTLTPWFFQNQNRLNFLQRFSSLLVELRDDLIPQESLSSVLSLFPKQRIFSVRQGKWDLQFIQGQLGTEDWMDVDSKFLHLLKNESLEVPGLIYSSHSSDPPSQLRWSGSLKQKILYKWSPVLSSPLEISEVWSWLKNVPYSHRLLAPRWSESLSDHDKTYWLRLRLLSEQSLHFVKFDEHGSYPGQIPWFSFAWRLPASIFTQSAPASFEKSQKWGAVIGNPIHHSFSPVFHQNEFQNHGGGFLSIPCDADTLPHVMDMAKNLSISYFAVTSPLKDQIHSGHKGNTLKLEIGDQKIWNTDLWALAWLKAELSQHLSWFDEKKYPFNIKKWDWIQNKLEMWLKNHEQFWKEYLKTADDKMIKKVLEDSFEDLTRILIIGGGGLKESLSMIWPSSVLQPYRNFQESLCQELWDLVIWATRSSNPPDKWIKLQTKILLDLNYHDTNQGRLFLFSEKVQQYISGLTLFVAQGFLQKKIWWGLQ